MCILSLKITAEPSQNGGTNENVTECRARAYHGAVDTEYANECFMQPHEVWREVTSLGYFPDKVLQYLERGGGLRKHEACCH